MVYLEFIERNILYAQGYLELGMLDDAWRSLDELESPLQADPLVLRMRMAILMAGRKWDAAAAIGRAICEKVPGEADGYIHTAFCLHEMKNTEEAREMLLAGPHSLRSSPLFHYNLGCYEAQLGEFDTAAFHVRRAIQLDPSYKAIAMEDSDLKPIQHQLGWKKRVRTTA